jgi:hypothetical protein
MMKLNDTQLVILSAASQRADGSVLPLPKTLTLKGSGVNPDARSPAQEGPGRGEARVQRGRPPARGEERSERDAGGQRGGPQAIGIERPGAAGESAEPYQPRAAKGGNKTEDKKRKIRTAHSSA